MRNGFTVHAASSLARRRMVGEECRDSTPLGDIGERATDSEQGSRSFVSGGPGRLVSSRMGRMVSVAGMRAGNHPEAESDPL